MQRIVGHAGFEPPPPTCGPLGGNTKGLGHMLELLLFFLVAFTVVAVIGTSMSLLHLGVVSEYERALKFVDGKYTGLLGPGRYWHFGFPAKLQRVDIRKRLLTVPAQEIITSDGVSIRLSLSVQYQVENPDAACRTVEDYQAYIYATLQNALRQVISAASADHVLEQRGGFSVQLIEMSAPILKDIGVILHGVDVKDVILPTPLKQVFAQVVNARKEGEAALEKARGEGAALRSLANSARLLQQNPNLYNLRLLQSIGESKGNTFVVGLPTPAATPLGAASHLETDRTDPDSVSTE